MTRLQFLVLFLLTALLMGCGTENQKNYDNLNLVQVSGTVKLGQNPLPNALVKFEAKDGQYAYGTTDSNGRYTLRFDSETAGVTPGEKTVRITTAIGAGEEGSEEVGEEPAGESSTESQSSPLKKTELVPEQYNKKSKLKRTVKPDESQTFDFDLTP